MQAGRCHNYLVFNIAILILQVLSRFCFSAVSGFFAAFFVYFDVFETYTPREGFAAGIKI